MKTNKEFNVLFSKLLVFEAVISIFTALKTDDSRMHMKISLSLVLILLFNYTVAQINVPQNYFQDPMEIPLILSGTFAELRSNHFHGGLDIKTQQREGIPVVAAAQGYISRINVSPFGYGKALYIQHPNGYTTVYAHLRNFSPEIEQYIKKIQYRRESYRVEVYPKPHELPVGKGEHIAYSGNTGGSGGPHLHFEIRDSQQRPMNPLLFGYQIKDTRKPIIQSFHVYPQNNQSHVNGSARPQQLNITLQSDGNYLTQPIEASGLLGFGISTVDQQDEAHNRNGVYRLEADLNEQRVFQANFERFSFAETRHLNQLIDYEHYMRNRNRVQKLFVEKSNPLSIYSNTNNSGYIDVKEGDTLTYTVTVRDFAGNYRQVKVPIKGRAATQIQLQEDLVTPYLARVSKNSLFEGNGIDVYIPANSLYQDTYLDIEFQDERIILHEEVVPLHTNIRIGFDVSHYQASDRQQLYVARLTTGGSKIHTSTQLLENRLVASTRSFGTYVIAHDQNPPVVTPVNFQDQQWISNNKDLRVKITDNETGIKDYRATINGKFILMEYEYKDNLLTYDFADGVITETENNFELVVTDNVGNTTTYRATFFRKNNL